MFEDHKEENQKKTRRQSNTAQKMKFSIEDFLSKCDQILKEKLHFSAV